MSFKQMYKMWMDETTLEDSLREELELLMKDEAALKDAFYAPLEFGTAGMRGLIGVGVNRMNIYTVRQATEGLACLLESKEGQKKRGVVIAYDSRRFSSKFAMESAKILANHEIPSFVFEGLRPTPELSFAVRELGAIAGIMVTASHNPAVYNGYKVYGEDGGQMPPKDASALTRYVRSIENPLTIKVADEKKAKTSGLIKMVGEELDKKYLELVKGVTINQELVDQVGKDLKLVFTPLHGAGEMLGRKALEQAGFTSVSIVKKQAIPDGKFPTIVSPNPEEHSAFELAIKLGNQVGADVLMATDPDADRLGVAVRLSDGSYQVLTGNQIGAIFAKYILEANKQRGTLPKNAVILKSIVSTDLVKKIADSYKVEALDVLTGFKFIAEKIKEFERTNSFTYLFGFEESYGYLIKPFVRDKDAIQALLLTAEVAAFYKKQGKTLYDGLQDIFKEYGYYEEKTISITMSGVDGAEKIEALMEKFRNEVPSNFVGIDVSLTEDYKTQTIISRGGKTIRGLLPPSNVLKYLLTDGSWIAVRPSGTEPKMKFYMATSASSQTEASMMIKEFEKEIRYFISGETKEADEVD
ncbi:MAG: phospho-sugar mutase [Lactobacillales bacterium]|jgi:phosphoglucomutase|nr:phospho-sugar mutase [Lactobacillales bacterium]